MSRRPMFYTPRENFPLRGKTPPEILLLLLCVCAADAIAKFLVGIENNFIGIFVVKFTRVHCSRSAHKGNNTPTSYLSYELLTLQLAH